MPRFAVVEAAEEGNEHAIEALRLAGYEDFGSSALREVAADVAQELFDEFLGEAAA